MQNKTCKHCNKTKTIEHFKSGHAWYCNECQPEIEKIRKKKNVIYATKYNQKNRAAYNEYRREYTKRSEVKKKTREYRNKKYKEDEIYREKMLAEKEKYLKIKNSKPIYLMCKNQKPIYYVKHKINAENLCKKYGYEYQEINRNNKEIP